MQLILHANSLILWREDLIRLVQTSKWCGPTKKPRYSRTLYWLETYCSAQSKTLLSALPSLRNIVLSNKTKKTTIGRPPIGNIRLPTSPSKPTGEPSRVQRQEARRIESPRLKDKPPKHRKKSWTRWPSETLCRNSVMCQRSSRTPTTR